MSGKIIDVNQMAIDSPEIINQSPFDDGWLIRIKFENSEEIEDLMNESDYNSFIQTLN